MRPTTQGQRVAFSLAALVLVVGNLIVWQIYLVPVKSKLEVTFLDVGQGDAVLITGPTGIEVLVDGGPDRSVLRKLPKEVGLLDRRLDMVVATHFDKDHIAGLTDVLGRYAVATILTNGATRETPDAEALETAIADERGATLIRARTGMRIHLGGGAYADVLYPDRDVAGIESNDGSIAMRVVYGNTSFMLTGDASSSVEETIEHITASTTLESSVLKAGHHGSRTSTSAQWLAAVDPAWVVISAGKDNRYGHPHQEVVDRIAASGATIVSTAQEGTLHFFSDGVGVWRE